MIAGRSSDNTFLSGAGSLNFKTRAGQIGCSVANGSSRLQHFEKSCIASKRNDVKMGPATSLHASTMYTASITGKEEFNLIWWVY